MAEDGYKSLISYELAQIPFDLGWDFVPDYYHRREGGYNENLFKKKLEYKKSH